MEETKEQVNATKSKTRDTIIGSVYSKSGITEAFNQPPKVGNFSLFSKKPLI